MRSGIILIDNDRLALIERICEGRCHYVFPGGKVEPDETPEDAAIRETYEELGVHVELQGLAAIIEFRNNTQHYYRATWIGGEFGTGHGPEFTGNQPPERGSYRAVWLPIQSIPEHNVRPPGLAHAIFTRKIDILIEPLHMYEAA